MNQGHAELNMRYAFSDNHSLNLKLYYYDNDRQLPGVVRYYTDDSQQQLRERTAFGQLQYRGVLSPRWQLKAAAKWNWANTDYRDRLYPEGNMDGNYWQREGYLTAAALWNATESLRFSYASDYLHNDLNCHCPMAPDVKPSRTAWLNTLSARWNRGFLSATARILHSAYINHAERSTAASDYRHWSPSFSTSVRLGSGWQARLMWKDIFRMPSFNELYFYHRGDTLVYDADAFQTAEGSMLDALIRQLPGAELTDQGEIFVNGRKVESLLLNGEKFFDNNRQIMLENLPAYMVKTVKTYEKAGLLSQLNGRDMGDKEFVMDVGLKKQYQIGWMGNVEAGYGTEDRYLARLFAMRFGTKSRITLYGNLNNLNDNRKPGENTTWTPETMPTGLMATKTAGLDFLFKSKDEQSKYSGNLQFSNIDTDDRIETTGETFLADGNTFSRSLDQKKARDFSFTTEQELEVWNKRQTIVWRLEPKLTYLKTHSMSQNIAMAFNQNPAIKATSALIDSVYRGSNADLLIQQALEFEPNAVAIADESKYSLVSDTLQPRGIKVYAGEGAIADLMEMETVDLVLAAIVGFAGLRPTLRAIEHGKPIALANKETMVVAGSIVTAAAMQHRVPILPVDSEHSAIFQCLIGEGAIDKILLTASGGPFRGRTREQLKDVTLGQALNHPNWKMGRKVTIDSSSLMNKGLEVIEAKWLFGVDAKDIEVVVHPQSVVHSMVQFCDGSIKARVWYGMKCFELSESEEVCTSPADAEGLASLGEGLDAQYEKYLSLVAEGKVAGRRTYTAKKTEN